MKRLGLLLSVLVLGGLLAAPPALAASPPTEQVVYQSGGAVLRANDDLTGAVVAFAEPSGTTISDLAVSPDGKHVVYVATSAGLQQVVKRGISGLGRTVVAESTSATGVLSDPSLSWSGVLTSYRLVTKGSDCFYIAPQPDEHHVCGVQQLVLDSFKAPAEASQEAYYAVYYLDGGHNVRSDYLGSGARGAYRVNGIDEDVAYFAISSDGKRITWGSLPGWAYVPAHVRAGDLSGVTVTGVHTLVDSPTGNYNDLTAVTLSHDGETVYFSSGTRSAELGGDLDVSSIPFAGGSATALTDTDETDEPLPIGIAVDTTAPGAPQPLPAVLGARTTVRWTPPADDDVVATRVSRSYPHGTTVTVDVTAPATSYVDTTAQAGQTYTYAFRSVDAAGNVGPQATRQVTPVVPYATVSDPSTSASAVESFPVHLPPYGTYGVRVSTNGGEPSTWIAPGGHGATHTYAGHRGSSYRFFVTVADGYGNAGREVTGGSTVVPLDDTAARYGGSTEARANSSQYLYGSRVLKAAGAFGQIAVHGNRFQLIGDRCASCGVFDVYLNGKRLVGVDTRNAAHAVRQVLVAFRLDPTKLSTIVVKARGTAGRPNVVIDGFAVRT